MKSINFKSLPIGMLGTALVMVLMGMTPLSDSSSFIVKECPYLNKNGIKRGESIQGFKMLEKEGHSPDWLCKYLLVHNRTSQ